MLRRTIPALVALALLLAAPGAALAHRVSVVAYVDGNNLHGESYFSTGDPARNSQIKVFDGRGKLMAESKTDAKGEFSMPLPQGEPPWKVVLNAGEGHRAEYTMDAQELGLAGNKSAAPAPAAPKAETAPPSLDQGASLGRAELEQVLSSLLSQQLAPLKAQLARMNAQQGVNFHDVIAGLGYILGLLGLAAYLHYRKQGQGK